jgi:hypothetical protein
MIHHSCACGHQHEQERAEEFREKTAPFLVRVIEVVDAINDALLVSRERPYGGQFLFGCHG